tara:strand:- start:75 stop:569 length:495 start_codon:yes stop_codon:yes gene_type:complete
MIVFIILVGLIFGLYYVKNPIYQHLIIIAIIFLLALISKKYEKYDREYVEEIMKKLMIITCICGIIGVFFGKYLKPEMEMILVYALLITIIFSIIDTMILKSKNKDMINYISIFIFSGFIMYDTKRLLKNSKICKEGNADYIMGMFDMFLNLLNTFQSLAELGE